MPSVTVRSMTRVAPCNYPELVLPLPTQAHLVDSSLCVWMLKGPAVYTTSNLPLDPFIILPVLPGRWLHPTAHTPLVKFSFNVGRGHLKLLVQRPYILLNSLLLVLSSIKINLKKNTHKLQIKRTGGFRRFDRRAETLTIGQVRF